MGLRFSLKWLLAAVVYAAVGAAALSQPTWVYADLVWVATLAAFGYALALALFARGTSQARGGGFALLAAAFVVCVFFAPESVPTARVLSAMTASDESQAPANVAVPPPATMLATAGIASGNLPANSPWYLVAQSASGGSSTWLSSSSPAAQGTLSVGAQRDPHWPAKLRAANAVGTMTIGLMGCLLGHPARAPRR